MKMGYVEAFAKLAERKNNIVTEQELFDFQQRYRLTRTEIDEIKEYCKEHGISIIYAEDPVPERVSYGILTAGTYLPKEVRSKIIRTIASLIVNKGAIRARKRTKGRGWLCGTYTSSKRKTIEREIDRRFTDKEIEFIKAHLPEDSDDETGFALQDPERQEMCDDMSSKLNALIPRLYMNHYWSDFMDD